MGGFEHRCLGPALRLRALLIATRPGSQSVWPAVRQRSGDSERRWATEVGDALVVASLGGAFRVLAGAGKVDWVLLTTVVPRGARGRVENGRLGRAGRSAGAAVVLCWRGTVLLAQRTQVALLFVLLPEFGLWRLLLVAVMEHGRGGCRGRAAAGRAPPTTRCASVCCTSCRTWSRALGHRTPRPPRSKDGTGRCGVLWRAWRCPPTLVGGDEWRGCWSRRPPQRC